MPAYPLDKLSFQHSFRRYQQQILDHFEAHQNDPRLHLIAPPGSGKTVVGLELIRRLAQPAVVFAPNTTIQAQWRHQVSLFLAPAHKHLVSKLVSLDPHTPKFFNIFTYQLISTQTQDKSYFSKLALHLWHQDLIENRLCPNELAAQKRLQELKQVQPQSYRQDFARYLKRSQQQLLSADPQHVATLLHTNAKRLVTKLVNHGVKTIVLDEVHHLLDYWAIVIRYLESQIDHPHLIGLTATPPESASNQELANYLRLMGQIDYQIPTPAVVKEGNLAPYQDLVYLCTPTAKEKAFINHIQDHFDTFIHTLAQKPEFNQFIQTLIFNPPKTPPDHWRQRFHQNPTLMTAAIRYVLQVSPFSLPRYIKILPEMKQDLQFDDWALLLQNFALNFLKLSPNSTHQELLDSLKQTLKTFGLVITEAGIRTHRPPVDIIFALSQAKKQSVINILSHESHSLGSLLRAVVITDFEKMSLTAQKRVKNILDPYAGGAVDIFKNLVEDPQTTQLEPILITGTSVLIDAHEKKTILSAMRRWLKVHAPTCQITTKPTAYDHTIAIEGTGPQWKSSTYVRMVTSLFDAGITRCLVGTRGLIGEGWDSLSANTLIDLTATTTSTTNNQIRGRALRLDPAWPQKLSNLWYVACFEPSFDQGNQDLNRLAKKHQHVYGLDCDGRVIKGLVHLNQNLAFQLSEGYFKKIIASQINQSSFHQAAQRQAAYKLWQIGQPYSNLELSTLSLKTKQVRFKTIHTLKDSATAISRSLFTSVASFSLWFIQQSRQLFNLDYRLNALLFFGFILGLQFHAGTTFIKFVKKILVGIPVDHYVKDMGLSVVEALAINKLISPGFDLSNLGTTTTPNGRLHLHLTTGLPKDAKTISLATTDLFAPISNQRYLISRELDRFPLGIFTPLWWLGYQTFKIFGLVKPTYHPVPDILATNRHRAESFAKTWKRYVGGGKLIYTHSLKGSRLLLKLREYHHDQYDYLRYDSWQ